MKIGLSSVSSLIMEINKSLHWFECVGFLSYGSFFSNHVNETSQPLVLMFQC